MPESFRVSFPLLQLAPDARVVERLPRTPWPRARRRGSLAEGRSGPPRPRNSGDAGATEGARPGRRGATRRDLAAFGAGSSAPSPQLGLAVGRGGNRVPTEGGWGRPPRETRAIRAVPGSLAAGERRAGRGARAEAGAGRARSMLAAEGWSEAGATFAARRGDGGGGEVAVQQRGRARASPGQCRVAVPVPPLCCLRPPAPAPAVCSVPGSNVGERGAERQGRAAEPGWEGQAPSLELGGRLGRGGPGWRRGPGVAARPTGAPGSERRDPAGSGLRSPQHRARRARELCRGLFKDI